MMRFLKSGEWEVLEYDLRPPANARVTDRTDQAAGRATGCENGWRRLAKRKSGLTVASKVHKNGTNEQSGIPVILRTCKRYTGIGGETRRVTAARPLVESQSATPPTPRGIS